MSSHAVPQFLAESFTLAWRVTCPAPLPPIVTTAPTGGDLPVPLQHQRAHVIATWPSSQTTAVVPRTELFVRYAAGLVALTRQPTHAKSPLIHGEIGRTLHALAYTYQLLADQQSTLEPRRDYLLATARCLHLATDTFVAHALPVPWERPLPAFVHTQAEIVHVHNELPAGAAACVAAMLCERQLEQLAPGARDMHTADVALRAHQAHWQSALLSLSAPALLTDADQERLSDTHVQEQLDLAVRHHDAAAARLDEVVKALSKHNGAAVGEGRQLLNQLRLRSSSAFDESDRVRNVNDARKTARGAYVNVADAETAARTLLLQQTPLVLPNAELYAPIGAAHVYHIDNTLATEADSWAATLATNTPTTAAVAPPRSLSRIMAQVLGVPEHTLIKADTGPRTMHAWRVALTAALLERKRQYDAGYGGPDRVDVIKKINAAVVQLGV